MSAMSATNLVLACLISAIPGPPGVRYEDAYIQLFPVDKTKCPTIDPVRDIAFQLFTRNNPLMADVLKIGDDDALAHSHMDFSDPTVIFFHAFFESSTGTTAWTIKTAYLQRKQHNLILINAPRLEAGPWYFTAARNTRVVGEYTATFIDYLVSKGMPLQSLHLLGLSLGAQMAGVAGSNVRSGRVPRITGLDPAGPLFTKLPNSLKLDKSDAEFVDVIHTDAGIFGYPRAIGHADFWPNQGISPQRGCMFPEIKKRNPDTLLELFFCSHWRSYQFYAESVVNENGFLALSCNSWQEYAAGKCNPNQQPVNMGYSLSNTARGNYYLTTNPESPFSLEGNPKTLAESTYTQTDNSYYPVVNPDNQISLQENTNSMSQTEYPVPPYSMEENPIRTSFTSNSSAHNNYYYYPAPHPEAQLPLQENTNSVSEAGYPKAAVSWQGDLKIFAGRDYGERDNYYPGANPESPMPVEEHTKTMSETEYQNSGHNYYAPNADVEHLLQDKFKALKERVYNPQSSYDPTNNVDAKLYLPENPPKMQNQYYY